MRQFDLSPLYRSTVGFDRVFSILDQLSGLESPQSPYPPYNIERLNETDYQITLAVAGFSEEDITIEVKESVLSVRAAKEAVETNNTENTTREILYRGIATRAFERRFQLADHVQVSGASLKNGLLHINLVRQVPEAAKPRRIPIGGARLQEVTSVA